MNKTLILTLFCVLFASATTQSNFNINQAADALQELLSEANKNLSDLQEYWAVKQPYLQQFINDLSDLLVTRQAECQNHDLILASDQAELDNARRYVAWLHKRIEENQDHITNLLADRCKQNNNHIETIKNDKIALSLVQFLRDQIEHKESFDFAQRKSFMNKLTSFLSVYRRGNLSELILLQKQVAADYEVNVDSSVHGRSDEEIGQGHVDNNKQELDLNGFQSGQRESWGDIRAEFLEILNGLEQTILQKIAQSQEDEIRASVAAADLKLKLEHEIEVYQQELIKWNTKVFELENTVAHDQEEVAYCRFRENNLKTALASAEKDLENETNEFNHKQLNFQEEIQIFQEVLDLYNPSTAHQDDDFKARADDYLDDGTFQNGDYNDREVPDYHLLNN